MATLEIIYEYFLEHRLICTDSRKITIGCIFFALSGENFNGNLFALEALEKGAAYAVVDQEIDSKDPRLIRVENTLSFLQDLSTKHRLNYHIPIIAITGSNGKTTTKELIASVLSADYNVHFTKGNFNNHIGVPLTLLQMTDVHEIAIIEMGANHQSEITELCRITRPTHGLITNIGKAHLEGFGGVKGVAIGKGELFDYLIQTGGIVFANLSEISLEDSFKKEGLRKVAYSNNSKKQGFVDVHYLTSLGALSIEVDFHSNTTHKLHSHLQGMYNLPNVVNAICIGIYFRVSPEKIVNKIEAYVPNNNRSQKKIIGSNHFILDAYNANPSSMRAAIENFSMIDHSNKIAILGDMYELGEYSEKEHLKIAQLAIESGFQKVIFVGTQFPNTDFKDVDELVTWFNAHQFEDTFFLIKGSRGIALEKLLEK